MVENLRITFHTKLARFEKGCDMNIRLQDFPVFGSRMASVSAEHFNLARVALKRLQNPYRLQLPKLRTLDLIVEDDAWIVVDRGLNDILVVAWLDFETRDRTLHDPVPCRLNVYHTHALIIVGKVMEAMALLIGEALAEHAPQVTAGVTPLRNC